MNKSPDVDRGWAYAVLAGYFFSRMFIIGMSTSPGILYQELYDYYEMPPALVAFTINLNPFVMNISGGIASAFVRLYGCRKAIATGCLLSTTGLVLTSFSPSILFVLIFYGILTGFGNSLINIACLPIMTAYFDKYRGVALLSASSGVGVGQFVLPYLFFSFSNAYSWKGALIVMAGLNLNFLVVAAAFMPPRMGYEEEIQRQTFPGMLPPITEVEENTTKLPVSITRSVSECHSAVSSLRPAVKTDVALFRDYCFILIFFRFMLGAVGVVGMMTQVKAYGIKNGLTDIEATTLLSFVGLFGLIGIVTMTLLLHVPRMNVLILNMSYSMGMGIAIIILGVVKTKTAFFIVVAVIGCFSGLVASFPLVVMSVVGAHRIAAGVGFASIAIGMGSAAGGPVGAALCSFDPTCSTSFATLGALCMIGASLQIPVVIAKSYTRIEPDE